MATPNQMPKRPNKLRMQLLSALLETKKITRTRKVLGKDDEGKPVDKEVKESIDALRFPLAQNMSDDSVNRLAGRWLK